MPNYIVHYNSMIVEADDADAAIAAVAANDRGGGNWEAVEASEVNRYEVAYSASTTIPAPPWAVIERPLGRYLALCFDEVTAERIVDALRGDHA